MVWSIQIVQQAVKDVLQSLVDDGLVTVEKIGTSNYYWSFPSAVQQAKNAQLQNLEAELNKIETSNAELERKILDAAGGRQDSVQRQGMLKQLQEAEELDAQYQKELKQYSDNDPTLIEAQKNIFVFQTYCVDKFGVDRQEFNRNFGIPEDLDTLP
ncbi:hypothetical protein BGX24_004619 [Mortierella sp. AD032]|nr:hypothetical protein BGX24_004619 [Mortierella sp. AD032]